MSLISNQNQVAEKSILDISGRQTYLGNSFNAGFAPQALGVTTEVPVFLVTNPAGSTKSLFCFDRRYEIIVSSTDTASFTFYLNPTVSSVGTVVTPTNLRFNVASPLSTVATSSFPSVSSFGSQVLDVSTVSSGNPSRSNVLFILDPGVTLLLTAISSSATAPVGFQMAWYEI